MKVYLSATTHQEQKREKEKANCGKNLSFLSFSLLRYSIKPFPLLLFFFHFSPYRRWILLAAPWRDTTVRSFARPGEPDRQSGWPLDPNLRLLLDPRVLSLHLPGTALPPPRVPKITWQLSRRGRKEMNETRGKKRGIGKSPFKGQHKGSLQGKSLMGKGKGKRKNASAFSSFLFLDRPPLLQLFFLPILPSTFRRHEKCRSKLLSSSSPILGNSSRDPSGKELFAPLPEFFFI